jgi:hypothetical protein
VSRPRIPVDGKRADWPRKVSEIVGFAQRDIEALESGAVMKDTGTTDWTAATGTAARTTFDTTTVTTEQLAQRVKALIDDLIANGAIK